MAQNDISEMVIEQPKPIRKQVYEHLRNQILNCSISPSSRLVEAKIAKEIGISRTPVREALHLLEKDGFVESIPRVGYRVKQLEWDELMELFEIRRVNETLACHWAVKRVDGDTIQALENNLDSTQAALDNDQTELFLKCDEEFHELLGQAAGSKQLFEICQQLRRLMLRYRARSISNRDSVEEALKGHRNIVKFLKARDVDKLVGSLVVHLELSKEDIRTRALKSAQGATQAGLNRLVE